MNKALSFLMLSAALTQGASWYVDRSVVGSANTGVSWANAWTNTTAIAWASVSAGDTIYLSGGTVGTNKSYNGINIGKSGSSGARIAIRVGQETEHNGLAILHSFNLGGYQHIDINGARSDAYPAPTDVRTLPLSLTNNTGIQVTHAYPGSGTTQGIYVNGASGANNTIRWVEIGPIAVDVDGDDDGFGMRMLNLTTNRNFLVEYCTFHDIRNDGINLNDITGTVVNDYDSTVVRWCYIGRTGDDGIQWSENGLTVENCFMDSHKLGFYHGHPDQLQFAGVSQGYFKVINSIMRNKANSLIIGEHLITEGGTLGPFIVAGNIFYATRDWTYITNVTQAYGISFSAWNANAGTSVAQGYMTNFYYLNNTMYFQTTEPFKVGRAVPSGSTRSVWDLEIHDSAIRNNLHLHNKWNAVGASYNFNAAGSGDPGLGTNGVYYTQAEFPMTHNINAGPNKSGAWHTNSFTDFSSFGNNNVSTAPNIETNSYTFALSATDSVARNAGYDLSAFTNQFPVLMKDLAGNLRFADGTPDIGALEYTPIKPELYDGVTNGLMLWHTYEDTPADADDGYSDWSTNGAHGRHYGYVNNHTASNRVPLQFTWTNQLSGLVNTGAYFQRYSDGWGIYGYSGNYLAVTNSNLRNLNVATISFWGRYSPSSGTGTSNWTEGANRRFIGGGYGYKGAWTIGLFGNHFTEFRSYTNDNANADIYVPMAPQFEIKTSGTGQGNSTNMNFYVLSFSNGVVNAWRNMVQYANNDTRMRTAGVTNLTVRGPSGSLFNGFLMVGGDNHNGNPNLTPNDDSGDQYPNHGFMEGTMDDFRIYGTNVPIDQLTAIYYGTNYVYVPPAEPTIFNGVRQINANRVRFGGR